MIDRDRLTEYFIARISSKQIDSILRIRKKHLLSILLRLPFQHLNLIRSDNEDKIKLQTPLYQFNFMITV